MITTARSWIPCDDNSIHSRTLLIPCWTASPCLLFSALPLRRHQLIKDLTYAKNRAEALRLQLSHLTGMARLKILRHLPLTKKRLNLLLAYCGGEYAGGCSMLADDLVHASTEHGK
jgi:hypothetical protein